MVKAEGDGVTGDKQMMLEKRAVVESDMGRHRIDNEVACQPMADGDSGKTGHNNGSDMTKWYAVIVKYGWWAAAFE